MAYVTRETLSKVLFNKTKLNSHEFSERDREGEQHFMISNSSVGLCGAREREASESGRGGGGLCGDGICVSWPGHYKFKCARTTRKTSMFVFVVKVLLPQP